MRVITLARKPLTKGVSVADNVLRHGTGGLNIDGCRVDYCSSSDKNSATPQGRCTSAVTGVRATAPNVNGEIRGGFERPKLNGRWPPNVILEHRPECRQVGMKKIKGIPGTAAGKMAGHEDETGIYNKGWAGTSRAHEQCGYVDAEGNEVVANWDCHPECPVKALDEQSGDCPSGGSVTSNPRTDSIYEDGLRKRQITPYHDSGGASRFFRQVQSKGKR